MPYILTIVILVLLYIMNGMNEDRKDADRMFKQVLKEFKSPKCDSLTTQHKKEVDSLTAVIDWYRCQENKKTKKLTKKAVKVDLVNTDSIQQQ